LTRIFVQFFWKSRKGVASLEEARGWIVRPPNRRKYMTSLNNVQILGKITQEPNIRKLKTGSLVAEVGLGVSESYRKENGEWESRMHFVDVVLWNQQAEYARDNLKKGDGLLVLGALQYDSWEDKEGHKRSALKIKATRVQPVPLPEPRSARKEEAPAARERRVA
jgi:single stranded DNA-binding protein